MTKLDRIALCAKSAVGNGHVSKIDVINNGVVVETFTNPFIGARDPANYTFVLSQPIITDSIVLRLYPQTENVTVKTSANQAAVAYENFSPRVELWEVEIFGVPSTIVKEGNVIKAKDISNTQGACLLVATYTNENKNELASVEFVPLTNGEVTKDMTGYSNYKVFFTDGLNGLISYKVFEG